MRLFFLIIFSLLIACKTSNRNPEGSIKSQKKDSLLLYNRGVNDSIFLGFRLGMSPNEVSAHILKMQQKGLIHISQQKVFAFINMYEVCSKDLNGTHHVVAELSFTYNQESKLLDALFLTLYGPRFYITPVAFHETEAQSKQRLKGNPLADKYEEITGASASIDSLFDRKVAKSYVRSIQLLYDYSLIPLFVTKYGEGSSRFVSEFESENSWLSEGRYIVLVLNRDYEAIANEYLSLQEQPGKLEYKNLIYIGHITYSSHEHHLKYEEAIRKASSVLVRDLDSLEKEQKEMEQKSNLEKARNSGI